MKTKFIVSCIALAASFNASASADLQSQINDLRDGLHSVHVNTLGKYSETWGLEDRANISALQQDQQRQDAVFSAAVTAQAVRDAGQDEHINAVQGSAQTANDRATALESRADAVEGAVRETNDQLADQGNRITNAQNTADTAIAQGQSNADDIVNVGNVASAADSRSQNNAIRLDTVEQGQRATNSQLEVTDARSISNAERLDGAEGAIRETNAQVAKNDKAINTRVDGVNNDLVNTNTRLDATVSQVQTNTNDIVNVGKTANVALATGQKAVNDAAVAQSTADTAVKGVQKNSNRITNVETVQGQHSATLNNHENRISTNEQNISTIGNDFYGYQQSNDAALAAGDARTLSQSKTYTNEKFTQLKSQVDRNSREISETRKEARGGIASVAAMANIPQVPGNTFTVGAGIGQFADQTAIAVGGVWAVSSNVSAKLSVGYGGDKASAGAGIGFGF